MTQRSGDPTLLNGSTFGPVDLEESFFDDLIDPEDNLEEEEEEEEPGEEEGPVFDDSEEARRARGDMLESEQDPPKGEQDPPKGEQDPPKGEQDPPKGEQDPPKGEQDPPKGEQAATGSEQDPPKGEQDTGDDQGPPKGWIPRYRYNEKAQQVETLQQENERLKREQGGQGGQDGQGGQAASGSETTTPDERLTAIDKEMSQALVDQDSDKVAQLRQEERQLLEQKWQQQVQEQTSATRTEVEENQSYQSMVSQIEESYPELNEDSDQFDETLARRVVELRDTYSKAGEPATRALSKAMEYAEEMLTMRRGSGGGQQTSEQAQQAEKDRQKEAKRTAAEAATQQPPDMGSGTGEEAHRGNPDPQRMSEEEFDALPDTKKAELRGDFL